MALGSSLTQAQEHEHSPVVVISYRLWQEAFASDPNAIGKTFFIKGVPFTVVQRCQLLRCGGLLDSSGKTDPQLNAGENPSQKLRVLVRRSGGICRCSRGCDLASCRMRHSVSCSQLSGRPQVRASASWIQNAGLPIWDLTRSAEFPALKIVIAPRWKS